MRIFARSLVLLGVIGGLTGAFAADSSPAIKAASRAPLSFERVTGGNTHWMARGNGYRLAVGAADVEVGLNEEQLRILFIGADPKAASSGLDKLPGKMNYFVGRDPKGWLRDVPMYARVRYGGVYPGVDTVWYGNQGMLEYDLVVQPGADASRIAMRFEGARKVTVQGNGDLRVDMANGSLSLKLPSVYQEGNEGRKPVASGYELRAGNEVSFHLGAYDDTRPLVIDPTLVYASYFGSASPTVAAVTVDGSGNVYIGGYTSNSFLPAVSAVQAGLLGHTNAFVSKFDPTGTTLLYSTYLGGSGSDHLTGIAVGPTTGKLVGVGYTQSPDFPVVNAAQPTVGPSQSGFAFELSSAGNQLVYSTYLGGMGYAYGNAVALDATGNAYITGYADGSITTSGAVNNCCTLVEKLSPTGSEVYAALIGSVVGSNQGNAIAVDSVGAAYVAGYTNATSFSNNPPGAHTTSAGGGDAFVAKLSPTATSVTWATFLGGSGRDSANAIALGTGNVVYVGGQTASSDLPVTAGVVQGTYGGGTDAFLANLSADGSSFGWVTYLGGAKSDTLSSLAVGATGLIVSGNTASHDFPTASAVQPAFPGSPYSLMKSTNSGGAFQSVDAGLPAISAGVILPDPSSAGTLVVDTGLGIFRSTDDGATWANVEPNSAGGTARSLSSPSTLYSADTCSLYHSTNGGQSWNAVYTNCTVIASVVAISPTNPNTVLLFSNTTEYRSTNGGTTFSPGIAIPFSSYSLTAPIVASPDGSLYAATGSSGLYKSTDAGSTWTKLSNGAPANALTVALSSSNAAILYAADGNQPVY